MKLPVDPERLRSAFPSLTDEDLAAYESVTRELLGDVRGRGRRLADLLALAQRGKEKEAAFAPLDEAERRAVAYAGALAKMQPG